MRARSKGEEPSPDDLAVLDPSGDAESDDVVLVSLPAREFEAMRSKYTTPEGEIDVPAMRPVLLAECAEEESLRDPEFWVSAAESGALSDGDLVTLWQAAFSINAQFGSVGAPKG